LNKKFYYEAFIQNEPIPNSYCHLFFTNDTQKLKKSPEEFDFGKYNINSWAKIPLDNYSVIDVRLFVNKNNEILEHTVQYRNDKDNIKIRSDYGHGPNKPHFDIIITDKDGKQIANIDVIQNVNFLNFECIINAVFMQIEKYDVFIGPKFWISPINIHPERINIIYKEWKDSNIKTSLAILSRIVFLDLINKTQNHIEISNEMFHFVVKEKIFYCKKKEKELGGSIDIQNIIYDPSIVRLPFNIVYEDDTNTTKFYKCFDSNGSELNIELLGFVNETKRGKSISRNYIKGEF